MRLPVTLTLAAATAHIALANNFVTIFLPAYDPWPSWQGEVHGIDATATTYLIHCAGPQASNCAVRQNLTVTQGPSTLAFTDYPTYSGGVTLTAHCDLPAETTALVTCPDQPGFTFTLPYASMNPQLIEITKTTWYNGPPTATPTGRDPATASLFGSGTSRLGGVDCGGAIFCGGLIAPVETGMPGGVGSSNGGGYMGDGGSDSQSSSTTDAPTPTNPNAEFESAVAAVTPFVTDRIPASEIVEVLPVYDSGGTLVVGSNDFWGVTTVSIGPGSDENEGGSGRSTTTATTTGRQALFSSGSIGARTTTSTTATSTGAGAAGPAATGPADVKLLLLGFAGGLAALVQ